MGEEIQSYVVVCTLNVLDPEPGCVGGKLHANEQATADPHRHIKYNAEKCMETDRQNTHTYTHTHNL